MANARSPFQWSKFAQQTPDPAREAEARRAEERAIEIERWAIEDAVARAIAGQRRRRQPSHMNYNAFDRWLPGIATVGFLFILAYLKNGGH